MTLSVLIPTWSGTQALADMAITLCESIRDQCDELIITEDSRNYYPRLQELSDLYLMHENWGDITNMCRAYPLSTGDYLASINSDVIIKQGTLKELCLPGRVTSPICVEYSYYNGFQGPFFVVPREILDSYGYLDITKQRGADYDYATRTRDCFTSVDVVHFSHQGGGKSYSEKRRLLEEKERREKERQT